MKNKTLLSFYILVATLLLATCVREIDYKRDEVDKTALVVNGSFYDNEGPFELRLTRPTDYDKRDFEPVAGAQAILSDDLGHQYFYQETGVGVYQLSGLRGEPGRSYTLDIQLADGARYRSHAQKMPAPLPVESAELRVKFEEEITTQGVIVSRPAALIYAHARVPDQSDGRYLRWETSNTFIFNESGPTPKQCFITGNISPQIAAIADPSEFQTGAEIVEYAGRRKVDYAFDLRSAFSVYQRTISKEAFQYWTRVKQVIEPTGTIFDPPPAVIRGNVENLDDPTRPALGFFEVASSDTARIFVNRGNLPFNVVAFIPVYCNSNSPGGTKPECGNCLLFNNSSLQKPDWWQ